MVNLSKYDKPSKLCMETRRQYYHKFRNELEVWNGDNKYKTWQGLKHAPISKNK